MSNKSSGFGLDDLARQLADSLPGNLRVLGNDFERNFKVLLQSGFERMDLVTREEFDVQTAVLERTREKLEALESRLAELENDAPANRSESPAYPPADSKPSSSEQSPDTEPQGPTH